MLLVVVPWTELGTDIVAAVAHNPFEVHHYCCMRNVKPAILKEAVVPIPAI